MSEYFTSNIILKSENKHFLIETVLLSTHNIGVVRFPTMWYVRPAWLRQARAYSQTDQSLSWSLEYSMTVKLLTQHHYLEFLSLKGGCTGWSESTLVKMPHCWKSDFAAQLCFG